ncbi:hypothetical protein ABDJ41_13965 [Pedobacter sp. ASV1-7]|uniref:capsular polysaccharide export protein, LipB/KpsS family n=1 Tax=Pedobacter sp. ASV1-7 TaxID=3145237 RepID=UPI0032E85B33
MILSNKQIIKARLRFILSFIKFKYFLTKLDLSSYALEQQKESNSYIIVLSPWLLTSTPWFAIATGILLHKRNHKVQVLIDDLQFENKTDHALQISLIGIALNSLKKLEWKVERLSEYRTNNAISIEELKTIQNLGFANAIHKNRGEEETAYFNALRDKNIGVLKKNFSTIKSFVEVNSNQTYIFPGGIYANSGLLERLLKKGDRSYFTFDSGFEVLLSTYKGIAAQFTDIPASLELLLSGNEKDTEIAMIHAKEEFDKRKNGTNKLNSQYQSFEQSQNFDKVGVLIPLNSPWDSAALNISSVFSGYNEWLLETVGLILENSSFNVTIRQHPDERFWWGKTKTDFNQLITDRYTDKRIQFVSCFDKVNSYALLSKSDAVVCYSSTFGIEASMSGKAVCVCSNVYYSRLGFSYKPSNVEDIKFFLKNVDSERFNVDMNKARLTYYLGQQCNWLFTPFTPMTPDLDKWLAIGIDQLLIDPTVNIYLESLEKHLPMSYVNHRKNYDAS